MLKKTNIHLSRIKLAIAAFFLIPMLSQAAETATTANILVKGTIVGNTCEIINGEAIDFGNLTRSQFQNNVYKKNNEKVISMSNCGSAADLVKITVLEYGSNEAVGSAAAKGVSVELYNGATKLSENVPSEKINLISVGGGKYIELIPAVRIDPGNFKEGEFMSVISIKVDYL